MSSLSIKQLSTCIHNCEMHARTAVVSVCVCVCVCMCACSRVCVYASVCCSVCVWGVSLEINKEIIHFEYNRQIQVKSSGKYNVCTHYIG